MAYEKYTWVDGELITAEKLNHIEDGIAEGGDTGYTCTETTEQLFSETVTTVESDGYYLARLNYSQPIDADELTVVFNGTEYVCPKIEGESRVYYGGIDPNTGMPEFTNYPFSILSDNDANVIATESPMTVTVSASGTYSTVETTECFEKAVKSVAGNGYECTETTEQLFNETVTTADHDGVNSSLLAYSEPITADKLIVLFDDTEYVCPKITVEGDDSAYYGGYDPSTDGNDFTDYPFVIVSNTNGVNFLATETANTYYIEVAAVVPEATNISPCFASAVKKSSDFSGKIKTATLQAEDISVDGSEAVLLSVPDDYSATVGVITIYPLETEDVYLADFDCSGDRGRFLLTYKSKQSSPVTIDLVDCVFTYIPTDGGEK